MLKRSFFLLVSTMFLAFTLVAELPKLAVLDVTIPKGFDPTVIVPITESIMEQMVASNKYTVLDRANIEAIFKERDFQLSGEVSNDQITQAGQFLGASFVVVSKLQLVGGSYFLSAKMIDTKSAVIVKQVSDSQKSDSADVVIEMGQNVGAKLTGMSVAARQPAPAARPRTQVATEPDQPADQQQAEPAQADTSSESGDSGGEGPSVRLVMNLAIPTWSSDSNMGDMINSYSDTGTDALSYGIEAYLHINLGPWLYIVGEYDYFESSYTAPGLPNYVNMNLANYFGGLGISIPIDTAGQLYAGALVGLSTFTIGKLFTDGYGWDPTVDKFDLSQDGLGYALEIGACIYLDQFFIIDFRVRFVGASFDPGSALSNPMPSASWYMNNSTYPEPVLDYTTISFGVGLAF